MSAAGLPGTLYGVGVGPGDPELLTLKALRVLGDTPVLALPSTGADKDGLAYSVVREALGEAGLRGKELLGLDLPMTRDATVLARARQVAAGRLTASLAKGSDVAFITIGDPLFFSTFSYLIPLVKGLLPSAPVVTVPGITSVSAAASAAGVVLSEASERVAVIPATYGTAEIRKALDAYDTVVLMKINSVVGDVLDLLEDMGITDRAVYVKRATWPDQEVMEDVSGLREVKPDYFSMMIIRK